MARVTNQTRRPRIRVTAIVEDQGKVLLVPHYSRETGDLVWFLPGGVLPHSETLRGALERVVEERTGLTVRATELRGVFEDIQLYRSYHSICFIFASRIIGGELKKGIRAETRPQWFEVSECPSLRLYPPFSQWENLIAERLSSQQWDGPGRMLGLVVDKSGKVLLCRRENERTWWPLRAEVASGEDPIQTLARMVDKGSGIWHINENSVSLFRLRANVVVLKLDDVTNEGPPGLEACSSYVWTDPALLTTYNMDPAVRRLCYDVLAKVGV